MLRRTRAYAVAIILIFAAFVAPSADPITMGIFAGPMYLLYEAVHLDRLLDGTRRTPPPRRRAGWAEVICYLEPRAR